MPYSRPAFTDPTGPGTPAWEQFDLAVATWRLHAAPGWSQHNKLAYHKFHNHRAAMVKHLRANNADITAWLLDFADALVTQED